MKAIIVSVLSAALAAMPLGASPSDTDRTLANVKGSVTYGASDPATSVLALNEHTQIALNEYAQTGASSLAAITFPDSSQVIMGSNSSVQMLQFDRTDMTHAKFVVVGRMRFKINHPGGAQADYRFQTTTGQIAVRGTEGDILANQQGLQVNVYAVSNPALPVQVTIQATGQVFTLGAGQSLVATAAAGTVTASVTQVSQSLFRPFQELGTPANAGTYGISAGGASGGIAAGTAAAAAAGAGAAAALLTAGKGSSSSPTAAPAATAVPITVSGGRRGGPRPRPTP